MNNLYNYFGDWVKVIDFSILQNIIDKLLYEYKIKYIYPRQPDVFKAFRLCSLKDLKIVMLGQDPYPQKDIATGILFGNKKETPNDKLSVSLNIIKESVIDFSIPHNFINFDPTLESWAAQGILLLNSALTVEMNKPNSHTMLWRPFISTLLGNISKCNSGIIYVLFGQQAQTFTPYINDKFNYIYKVKHPAYLARNNEKLPNDLFVSINNRLKELYGNEIKWYNELMLNNN